MDNLTAIHAHIYFVSDLFYYINVYSHGEIGLFQLLIIETISTSYNRKLHYCPTALQCG